MQTINYLPRITIIPNGGWFYGTFLQISTQIYSRINYQTGGGQNRGDGGGSEKYYSRGNRCAQDAVKNDGSDKAVEAPMLTET